MNSDQIKKAVKTWAEKVGTKAAHKALVNADVSLAVTQKLVSGSYEPSLSHDNALNILKLLKSEGFPLTDGKAS